MRRLSGIGMTSQRTRERLISQLKESGITHPLVLEAINNVPRHLFVDEALESRAYENTALPIGHGQTISQPYIVARMTECLLNNENFIPKKILEIGTGCGYQTAILAQIFDEIFTVERISSFRYPAKLRFHKLGLYKIHLHHADGHIGWKKNSPFDAIIVTAAASHVPQDLLDQLSIGGIMVMPLSEIKNGTEHQILMKFLKTSDGYTQEALEEVHFVPLLGDCC